jgi:uncharacterized Zn-binding protein involved in type VI secretion
MSESIAFALGESQIACTDGAQGPECEPDPPKWTWSIPTTQVTAATSNSKVFVEGKLVAVEGDSMASHPNGDPCVPAPVFHAPTTSLCADKVSIGGKKAVRIGSKFNTGTSFDHTVTTGSSKVFIGGPSVAV